MRKIKILFFYPNEFFGPELTVITQIIRNLDRRRFAIYLVLNSQAEGKLDLNELDGLTIRRWTFGQGLRGEPLQGLLSTLHIPGSLVSLMRYARHEDIDIVHCNSTPRAAIMGYFIAQAAHAKLLVHYHVLPGRYAGLRRKFENFVSQRADKAVGVSSFMADRIPSTGVPKDRIEVVANGVDLRKYHAGIDGSEIRREFGIADDEILILQLGRIIQQKRQEDVVRAFAIARRKVPKLRCLIVGWEDPRYTGPFQGYKAELLDIAKRENLGDSLIIAPARPDAPKVLAAADIFVMPSDGDSWNLAVTEAMASGKPVIGSLSGGIPEQILDGETGFLVPLQSPEILAQKMITLADNDELRLRMGKAARQRVVQYFDETRVAEGFSTIYEGLTTHDPMLQFPIKSMT